MIARILDWVKIYQRDILVSTAMGLIAWSSFNIGLIQGQKSEPIAIRPGQGREAGDTSSQRVVPLDARVVVSKNSSSRKYHYSWCGSGKRIKTENRVWFETAALAEAAGYTLAGNCR
jgi:hypothetical protein